MKKLAVIIPVIFLLYSCKNTQKTGILNNPDTTGYYSARNLEGLVSFNIDESTYNKTINLIKDDIRKDKNYRYIGYSSKTNYYEEEFNEFLLRESKDTISKTIELYNYFVDDFEIQSLKLLFLYDTLVSITCKNTEEFENLLTQKYGKPKSIEEKQEYSLIFGNKWENQKVELISYHNVVSPPIHYHYETINIKSKSRYPLYLKLLTDKIQSDKKLQELKKKETIEKL
jgi:hypothetical protein